MKVIGITGGVGSGKTALLSYISQKYNCLILLADEIAHQTMLPGGSCYLKLTELLSDSILSKDGTIDKVKMASQIFELPEMRRKVNEIIHPAVKAIILKTISEEKEKGKTDYLFIEAALLIEDGYLNIVDEMWYIYADEKVRRKRLRESRNYTEEKIDSILCTQLTEKEFRDNCHIIIDNSYNIENAYKQIDRELGADSNG